MFLHYQQPQNTLLKTIFKAKKQNGMEWNNDPSFFIYIEKVGSGTVKETRVHKENQGLWQGNLYTSTFQQQGLPKWVQISVVRGIVISNHMFKDHLATEAL